MKKVFAGIIVISCMIMVGTSYGVPFEPPVVTITGDPVENWQGGEMTVTFDLAGRDCMVYLAVYTKDQGANIPLMTNGLLDWHTVQGIDTCLYVSSGEDFTIGNNRQIVWDGLDKIGHEVPAMEYTYYLLASDNGGSGNPMAASKWFIYHTAEYFTQYETVAGGKLDKPRMWLARDGFGYYEIGADTEDTTRVVYPFPEGDLSNINGHITIDPENDDIIYFDYCDTTAVMQCLSKGLLMTDAPAEFITEFGDEGRVYFPTNPRSIKSPWDNTGGVMKDGMCVYASTNYLDFSDLSVIDSESGDEIRCVDWTEWSHKSWPAEPDPPPSHLGAMHWSRTTPNRVYARSRLMYEKICFNPLEDLANDAIYWVARGVTIPEGEEETWVWPLGFGGFSSYDISLDTNDFKYTPAKTFFISCSLLSNPN